MNLKYILILSILLLMCGSASAWLDGYSYRIPIAINNTGSNLTEYQYAFTVDTASLVAAGKMNVNGSDCRVTDGADALQLFWNETTFNAADTKIWVNATELGNVTNTTHYMYYGNSSASDISNGSTTFELFDNFDNNDNVNKTYLTTKNTVYDSTRYSLAPIVVKLHDGTLFASFCEGDAHAGGTNHDVKWINSTDNGTTWSIPQIVAAHNGSEDARNPGCFEFNNSGIWTILVFYDRQTTTPTGTTHCKKSTDGGVTWGTEIDITPNSTDRYTYGAGTQMPNGDLIFSSYSYPISSTNGSYVQISSDGGDTWTEYELWDDTQSCEVSICCKSTDGHVFASIRRHLTDVIYGSSSTDYGRTWSTPVAILTSIAGEDAPAPVTLLENGNLVIGWEKTEDEFVLVISDDNGTTFDSNNTFSVYYDVTMPHASGYVSPVQINDTHIYAMFYIDHDNMVDADIYGNFVDISNSSQSSIVWDKVGSPILDYNNGILHIHGTDNTDNRLVSQNTFSAPHILESRSMIDFTGGNYAQLGFGLFEYPVVGGVEFAVITVASSSNNNSFMQNANGINRAMSTGINMDSYFPNKIKWKSDEINYIYTGGTITHTTYIPTATLPIVIGGSGYGNAAFSGYYDWLFVRQYATIEPTSSIGAEESYIAASIVLGANQQAVLRKNITTAETFSTIAAGIDHDVCYTWWDSSTNRWESYRVGYSYNADKSVPVHDSYLVLVDGIGTTIECYQAVPESVIIPVGWYMSYLGESTNKTLHQIKTDMGGNVVDLYTFNSVTGTWTDTGSHSVQPNQGLMINSNAQFTWDRSVP